MYQQSVLRIITSNFFQRGDKIQEGRVFKDILHALQLHSSGPTAGSAQSFSEFLVTGYWSDSVIEHTFPSVPELYLPSYLLLIIKCLSNHSEKNNKQ